jgi:hypothetical protein
MINCSCIDDFKLLFFFPPDFSLIFDLVPSLHNYKDFFLLFFRGRLLNVTFSSKILPFL